MELNQRFSFSPSRSFLPRTHETLTKSAAENYISEETRFQNEKKAASIYSYDNDVNNNDNDAKKKKENEKEEEKEQEEEEEAGEEGAEEQGRIHGTRCAY